MDIRMCTGFIRLRTASTGGLFVVNMVISLCESSTADEKFIDQFTDNQLFNKG
jgi:hypothetical protein